MLKNPERLPLLWGELLANRTMVDLNREILIIGKDVEKSARSPKLWNAVFAELNSPTRMVPVNLELKKPEDLGSFLRSRNDFLGCAIGFPNKRLSAQFVNYANSESGINVLRNNGDCYEGFNSDGIAAVYALDKILTENQASPERILILGTGSTAESFYAALRVSNSKLRCAEILFYSRSKNERGEKNVSSLEDEVEQFLKGEPAVIVNATPLGSASNPNSSPLPEEIIDSATKGSLVLDFNYNNSESLFRSLTLSQNLTYSDGLTMNLFQAVSSFEFVFENYKLPETEDLFSIMSGVAA